MADQDTAATAELSLAAQEDIAGTDMVEERAQTEMRKVQVQQQTLECSEQGLAMVRSQ